MATHLSLASDSAQVEPGGSVSVSYDVRNTGGAADHIEITVDGVDPEWIAVPQPSVVLEPGQGQSGRFFLKPPRESHSMAGTYPFVLRARSLETGESVEQQGVLSVMPYTHVSVDVQPRRATVSTASSQSTIRVNVANLGNTEQTLQLFATDTDDVLSFEFNKDQVKVSPGQETAVNLTVAAKQRPFLANPRLQPVTVSTRSVNNASVGASTSLQVEQRGLITVANALLALFVCLLATAWYLTRPKPPIIESLSASPMNPTVDQQVVIKWSAADATSVTLNVSGTIMDKQPPVGEYAFVVRQAGKITIKAVAINNNRQSLEQVQVVEVLEKVVAPEPLIEAFEVVPAQPRVGETVTINYKVNDAVTSLYLSPYGPLEPKGNAFSFIPDKAGTVELKLTARNADGKVVEQSRSVRFNLVSRATIDSFNVSPTVLETEVGTVTVTWSLKDAARAELAFDDQKLTITGLTGTQSIPVRGDTTFTLTAYDTNGLAVSRKARVTVKKPDPSQPGGGPFGPPVDEPRDDVPKTLLQPKTPTTSPASPKMGGGKSR